MEPDRVITRRDLLGGLASRPIAAAPTFPSPVRLLGDPPASDLEREHQIRIRLPLLAHDGANVPIELTVDHPMAPDHYIRKVSVYAFKDPLVTKSVFHLTPHIGSVHLTPQVRMNAGDHRVFVVAECTRHGPWAASRAVKVSTGGCHTVGASPEALELQGKVAAPRLDAPDEVPPGGIFELRVKVKHPSRTGLSLLPDGVNFERAGDAFFVHTMEVFYGGSSFRPRLVAWVEMTAVMSDDPLMLFSLRADQEGRLRVVLTNNRDRRFEAQRQIRFAR